MINDKIKLKDVYYVSHFLKIFYAEFSDVHGIPTNFLGNSPNI